MTTMLFIRAPGHLESRIIHTKNIARAWTGSTTGISMTEVVHGNRGLSVKSDLKLIYI